MNADLAAKIEHCQTLPSLPATAVRVLEMARDPNAELAELAKLISQDPALSGKILRTVNSSFYARPQAVGTISQALVLLGMQSVRTLVLGFSLTSTLKGTQSRGFKHVHYWKRSAYAATAARLLAGRTKLLQVEEAFLASLMKDIGMLALDQVLGEPYGRLHEPEGGGGPTTHLALLAAERAALGTDHAEASGVLARAWKLPPVLAEPIARHHDPDLPGDAPLAKLTRLVALAGRCADVFTDAQPSAAIEAVRGRCAELYGLDAAAADALLEEVGAKVKEVASLFEIKADTSAGFDDILRRANETLVELTLQTQRQTAAKLQHVDDLEKTNEELKRRAVTDPLTGLANRGAFDAFLARSLTDARAADRPMALLLLDVDNFKAVNDRHGHPAGDDVLRHLARMLRECVRGIDLAARYGGEEMALVLRDLPRGAAVLAAERLRRRVAAAPLPAGKLRLPITVSIGVATWEPGSPLVHPIHLLRAADLAAYAAKKAGRNCVKVFVLPGATRRAA